MIPVHLAFAQTWPARGIVASMLVGFGAIVLSGGLLGAFLVLALVLIVAAIIARTRTVRAEGSPAEEAKLTWDAQGFTLAMSNFWSWRPWSGIRVVPRPHGAAFLTPAPPDGSSLAAWVPRRAFTQDHAEEWSSLASRAPPLPNVLAPDVSKGEARVTYQVRKADWHSYLRALRRSGLRPKNTAEKANVPVWVERWNERSERFSRRLTPLRIGFVVFAGLFMSVVSIFALANDPAFVPGWAILGFFAFLAILFSRPGIRLQGKGGQGWLPRVDAWWDGTGLYRTSLRASSWIAWKTFKGVHVEGDTLLLVTEYSLGSISQAVMLPLPAFTGAQLADIRARINGAQAPPKAAG